ncbi:MAG TPA: hypothetical protein VK572_00035 [Burkholderiales bacterium]|nr:hypothetical protein [Burkholderiales bacterium]
MSSEDKPLPLVLSLVNVGADEERYLRSLLALLKTYLEPSWCIAARLGDLPDAILVDMDSKEGLQVWENVDFGGTPRIALSRDQVLAAEWTLLKPMRPGGPHSLTEVLQAVAGKLQLSAPASSAPTSGWRPFANMVRRACQHAYPADVTLATGSVLVVDPQGQVFYSSRTTDELAALLRNRRRIDGKVVTVPDARKLAVRLARWGIRPRPLEELLWLRGLVAGAGVSFGAWDPHELVRLSRWPNFASLPHRQVHLKMAAILTSRETQSQALADACEVAAGDAADFLNACAEIGILEARTAPASGHTTQDLMKATVIGAWRKVVGSLKREVPE